MLRSSLRYKAPFSVIGIRVYFFLDKSKGGSAIQDFNQSITAQLKGRLDPTVPLDILHKDSKESKALQAVDLFSWGIFRKYERRDLSWHQIFQSGKVKYDDLYEIHHLFPRQENIRSSAA